MMAYDVSKYTYEECLRILHMYTQVIRYTTCPDVRNDYVQARAKLIRHMNQKWHISCN